MADKNKLPLESTLAKTAEVIADSKGVISFANNVEANVKYTVQKSADIQATIGDNVKKQDRE